VTGEVIASRIDVEKLREQVRAKYTEVAREPDKGFHFHTGKFLARILGYPEEALSYPPEYVSESFAGTGNPFVFGELLAGETVLDIGCGAGFDSLLAASQVGAQGRVIALDMTEAMLEKTQRGAAELGLGNVETRLGYMERLPVEDASIDVVISNGVTNLSPDKMRVMSEVWRVLKPGGRIQIADIVVHKEVPQDAKDDIDLWSG
jgi:SAM-dependent methyltransferase